MGHGVGVLWDTKAVEAIHPEIGGRMGVTIPVGWVSVMLDLEAKYGFKQGQVDEHTVVNTTLVAEPGTNQRYLITWQEVWE